MLHKQVKPRNQVIFWYVALAIITLFSLLNYFSSQAPRDAVTVQAEAPRDAVAVQAENLNVKHKPQVSERYQRYHAYRVEPGDSLYWIAGSYGISVGALKTLNDLESDLIRPGQRLLVPLDFLKRYPVGLNFSHQEVEWLAQMIYAEARGEPYLGQVAVAAVIINRILNPLFPNTLRGVLLQNNAFQPMRNGTFYLTANETAKRAALEALNGHDPTGGALYFFNPHLSTDRFMHSRTPLMTIGHHRFTK